MSFILLLCSRRHHALSLWEYANLQRDGNSGLQLQHTNPILGTERAKYYFDQQRRGRRFDFRIRFHSESSGKGFFSPPPPLRPSTHPTQQINFPNIINPQASAGTTTIRLNLFAPLQVEKRTNGAVAITRGALNFALELSFNDTKTVGVRCV